MSDLCPQGLPIYPQGQDPLLIFLIKLQFDSILKPTFSISSHVWCFWCHILYFFNSVYPCVNKFLSFNLHTRVVKFSTFTIYLLLQLDLFFNMCSCPFHYRRLECKSRMSRNTWSNRQIWPWNMEWSRAKANRVLPRKHTGHSKHPLPTTQEKTPHIDIHQQMVNTKIRLIIFFAAKDGEALYRQQKQNQELTVAQIMNSLLPNSDLNWRK